MSDANSKIAANYATWKAGVEYHDRVNPSHPPAYGIGVSYFDAERLGLEDGEELWAGIRLVIDGGTSGNFRVLCDFDKPREGEEEITEAVGRDMVAPGTVAGREFARS